MGRSRIKNIAYITGTRADYGLMKNVLLAINEQPDWNLSLFVCGMHLMPSHGHSINEIISDGFKIYNLDVKFEGDSREAMSNFVGKAMLSINEELTRLNIDTVILLGDRAEMIAGAIAAAYLGKLVIHFHGGDRTSTIDEPVRHAISKLAHIHLAATEDSANRLINMGEEENNVYIVGSPGLEGIQEELMSKSETKEFLDFSTDKDFVLILYHPVTESHSESGERMNTLLTGIEEFDFNKIIIFPNADVGNSNIIKVIRDKCKTEDCRVFENLQRSVYLSLLRHCKFLIGNSSSGMIEAASLETPVINVGERQKGRLHAANVLSVQCELKEIQIAVSCILNDPGYQDKMQNLTNPYGDGRTSERAIEILKRQTIDSELLQKKMTY